MLASGSGNVAARLWNKVMAPLHKGLETIKLYDDSKMTSVGICLDSGKLATDACKADPRGDRVKSVLVYAEDIPTESCDKHVLLNYCSTGKGVANEYCAYASGVTLGKMGLVKMTQDEINSILAAKDYGLNSKYLMDNYVYLVTADGKDGSFKGFGGNINAGVSSPYKICTVHTYANVVIPPETVEPGESTTDDNTVVP